MHITFQGAARTVTGSKHLIALNDGRTILLDCGMFQGLGSESDALNNHFGFEPASLSCVLLSHAHIDHSGLLPKLVKDGFTGKIFATPPTRDLCAILLEDSANIQLSNGNGNGKKEEIDSEAFYGIDDVAAALALFETVEYKEAFEVMPGVTAIFNDTGHLLGSASVHLTITEDSSTTTVTFSGDIGRFRSPVLCPPAAFPPSDYLIIESTYGDKLHEPVFSITDHLMKLIKKTCVIKKGQLVIPAFSLGRTQELLYYLNQLSLEKRLPDIPVFVDSPLSHAATGIFKNYKQYLNDTLQKIMVYDDDPFDFPGLVFTENVAQSKEAARYSEPCIVIAASGMADAGRIRHHIAATVENPDNTILMVGYCSPSSLGGKLQNGARHVQILGADYEVNAEIEVMHSMSAHGDADDLVRFLDCQEAEQVKGLFLVHGEYESQVKFRDKLMRKGFKNVCIPALHEAVPIYTSPVVRTA